ncbi:hypothetical protein CRG98_013179 [Punica granatum]|uniref:Uncharacterized protein n=1 Tax=Punica granatum TaxID=22663 RepID=A0A2I0KCX1_PUNGR|nr:hypothetical protein CRG98_013179 [Punica granatum]
MAEEMEERGGRVHADYGGKDVKRHGEALKHVWISFLLTWNLFIPRVDWTRQTLKYIVLNTTRGNLAWVMMVMTMMRTPQPSAQETSIERTASEAPAPKNSFNLRTASHVSTTTSKTGQTLDLSTPVLPY